MTENEKLDLILQKISGLDEKVETDMKEVRQQVAKTNFVLENEIRVNIQRVAEGHFNLSRNLHDAMRHSNEAEMLAIKVRMLESDVQELKRKIS